jgi:hypothetical protein
VNTGEDFPWDGFSLASEIGCGAGNGSGAANPNDLLSAVGLSQAGDIEESHVHGDSTEDGAEASLDKSVSAGREGAGQAVGVAGGDSGNTKIPRSTEGGAVADRFTFGNGPNEKNFGFPREDGLKTRGEATQRAVSVKTKAWASMGGGE